MSAISMDPIDSSSNISAIGYDSGSQTLAVQFRSGTTYHYGEVPPEAHVDLMNADSKGSHIAKFVKGTYAVINVVEPDQ